MTFQKVVMKNISKEQKVLLHTFNHKVLLKTHAKMGFLRNSKNALNRAPKKGRFKFY